MKNNPKQVMLYRVSLQKAPCPCHCDHYKRLRLLLRDVEGNCKTKHNCVSWLELTRFVRKSIAARTNYPCIYGAGRFNTLKLIYKLQYRLLLVDGHHFKCESTSIQCLISAVYLRHQNTWRRPCESCPLDQLR